MTVSLYDDKKLAEKSIFGWIDAFIDDLSEVLVGAAGLFSKIDAAYSEYDKVLTPDYKELREAVDKLRTSTQTSQSVPNTLDRAQLYFKGGQLCLMYQGFKKLIDTHKKLLKGLNINIDTILACLKDFQIISTDIEKTKVAFSLAFEQFAKIDIKRPAAIPTVSSHYSQALSTMQDFYVCLQNYFKLSFHVKVNLLTTFCSVIVQEAHKKKILTLELSDKDSVIKMIRSSPEFSALIDRAKELSGMSLEFVESSIYAKYDRQRHYSDNAKYLAELNPKVITLKNFSQGLSLSSDLAKGFCAGGIRQWSKQPANPPKVPNEASNQKAKIEFEALELDVQLVGLQDNQASFAQLNNSSDHFIFRVKDYKSPVALSSPAATPPNTAATSSTALASLIVPTDPLLAVSAYTDRLFSDVLETAKLYYHQVTIYVAITPQQGNGHAIGFKIIHSKERTKEKSNEKPKEKLEIYFCDYNIGEFYSEDIDAFKVWFRAFYAKMEYQKNQNYEISVIKTKTEKPKQMIGEMLSLPILPTLNTIRETQIFNQAEVQILPVLMSYLFGPSCNNILDKSSKTTTPKTAFPKALMIAFKTYQSSYSTLDTSDDLCRERILKLIPLTESDDERKIPVCLEILDCYNRLQHKRLEDHLAAFASLIDLIEVYEKNEVLKISQFVEKLLDVSSQMVKSDPGAKIMQIYGYLALAKSYIDNAGKLDMARGIHFVDQFCIEMEALGKTKELKENTEFANALKTVSELQKLVAREIFINPSIVNFNNAHSSNIPSSSNAANNSNSNYVGNSILFSQSLKTLMEQFSQNSYWLPPATLKVFKSLFYSQVEVVDAGTALTI